MEKKLQELTEKIYSEGVEKAEAEAQKILDSAKKKSDELMNKAKAEADKTIAEAEKKAEEIIRNSQSEMKLASNQAVSEVKHKLTDIISSKAASSSVEAAFCDQDFLKKLVETAVKSFFADTSKGMDIELLLPESERSGLDKFLSSDVKKQLDAGLKVSFDADIEKGFKIGPADGSYKLSFTEKDFENFFKKYLRPKTVELLFGGK